MPPRFDRSFLPPAAFEFVVLADTHYMPDPGPAVEFPSRRRQGDRADAALGMAAALKPDFVIHMGDLVQAVPESPDFTRVQDGALAQLARHGITPRFVAGNQDIGDKDDPTMPQVQVTAASLAAWHARFGPSWHFWDLDSWRFVVVNSQILNCDLPERESQRAWLERTLSESADRRLCVLLHVPPFICFATEPDTGHYDNIGQPDRDWLLDLIGEHRVELVLTGHCHVQFVNRIGRARLRTLPSTSHTRPGFGELFAAAPAPEQGRDDTPKLGFVLARAQAEGIRLHAIATGGATSLHNDGAIRLFTRLSADLPASPLVVTLTHPLAVTADVPVAWPSAIRQPARDDYPFLALLEMGARHVRFPASDLDGAASRERLAFLRDEGCETIATVLDPARADIERLIERHRELLDGVEIQLTSRALRADGWPQALALLDDSSITASLCAVTPGQILPGKQLPRTRIGFRLEDLADLASALWTSHDRPSRIVLHAPPGTPVATILRDAHRIAPGIALDLRVDFGVDDIANVARLAEALIVAATAKGTRVLVEPIIDLDRTMDVAHGLLDRLRNPRPAFHAARCLTTTLFSDGAPWTRSGDSGPDDRVIALARGTERAWLVLPGGQSCRPADLGATAARRFDLARGLVYDVDDAPLDPTAATFLWRG
ncbi:MAG: hypothetical protein EPO26_16305 [Chloroflexota bacterium]|nr:MAG: hypothetical protein EPO26_16305 [Chloroflexota bacterium]